MDSTRWTDDDEKYYTTEPTASLDGIDSFIHQLHMLDGILKDSHNKGYDVDEDRVKINRLLTEVSMIKELLKPRLKEYQKLDLEILFNYLPLLVRETDKETYKELTQKVVRIKTLSNED